MLLFLGAAFFVYYGQKNDRNGELFYSGTIEATQSHLSFQTGGRALQVAVREGEAVHDVSLDIEKGNILQKKSANIHENVNRRHMK